MSTPAPCGTWPSPITLDLLASQAKGSGEPQFDGQAITWLERRPSEGGRNVIVRRDADGTLQDLIAEPFNARTRVHEYGGGAYLPTAQGVLFTNFADQLLYLLPAGGGEPRALTSENFRYADMNADAKGERVYAVEEDHTGSGEPVNRIVRLDVVGDGLAERTVLAEGNDFYASPRLSPCGTRLAWVTWNHPNMPWDATELWIAHLNAFGYLEITERVAGQDGESAGEPVWSHDRVLYYVTDRSGFWNIHRWVEGKPERVFAQDAEFSKPHWTFGNPSFCFAGPGRLLVSWTERCHWRLGLLDLNTRELRDLDQPYTYLSCVRAQDDTAVFVAASPTEQTMIVRLDLSSGEREVLAKASDVTIDPAFVSRPEAIEYPTEGGLTAHAIYYAPTSGTHQVPDGERPPLLVFTHGGPTGSTSSVLRLMTQFWTSRGFAVLDVNYGGSSGYGRAYRQRLNGTWGVTDVDDCINGAQFLVDRGDVDPKRLAIRGGSAGGYTTLCALTFRDTFAAGASHFGVSDLEALAKETHKFESRYLDGLIGPYPERRDLYEKRSPIHHTDGLSCPVILLQGLEDKVVPPNQAVMMVDALKAKGIPVAYVPFEGEQHGFRKAENIKRAHEAELYFYGRVFGFDVSDLEPVEIQNLG